MTCSVFSSRSYDTGRASMKLFLKLLAFDCYLETTLLVWMLMPKKSRPLPWLRLILC